MDTMKQLDAVRSDLEEALRTQQNEGAMHKAKLLVAHESLELQKKATEAEKQEMLREMDHMVCVQSELQEALKRVTSKLVDTEKACLMLHEDLQAEKRRAAELELQVAELTTQVSKRNHDITEEVEYPRQQLPKHQQRPTDTACATRY